MTVVAVVDRDRGEKVVFEAATRADELDTDLHVVYVLEMGGFGMFELEIAERVGIPVGLDVFRSRCASIADSIAEGIVEEYEPVGLVGDPREVVLEYVRKIEADSVVVSGAVDRGSSSARNSKTLIETLRDAGFEAVPVY